MAVIVLEVLMDQIPVNIPTRSQTPKRKDQGEVVLFTVLQSCNDIININTHGLFGARRILLSKVIKIFKFME